MPPRLVQHISQTSDVVTGLAAKYGKTKEQIFFSFMHSQGVVVLTGTTSEGHMREDLEASSIQLQPSEIDAIAALLR